MSSQGENINHFTGVRFRINGSGNLKINLISLDATKTVALTDLIMSTTPGREPTKLCNYMGQRAQLECKTLLINERFIINRIVVFVKPVFTSFPG